MIDESASSHSETISSQVFRPEFHGSRSAAHDEPAISDLYSDLFSDSNQLSDADSAIESPTREPEVPGNVAAVTIPASPVSLADTGLTLMQLCDLILKQLYLQGNLVGVDVARQLRLPFHAIDDGLRFLKEQKCIEVASGEMIGTASYRFNLTDVGRNRAREAFEQCRYVGPAPVPLASYVTQCRAQAVSGSACRADELRAAFAGLVIRDDFLDELGPAVCSGKSIFLYGPPGNGKTAIAKGLGRFLNDFGGEIYVPYAIQTEGNIITVFDPTLHQPTDTAELRQRKLYDHAEDSLRTGTSSGSRKLPDLRWRRVRRPVVITGGELTLEMLDLRYNRSSNYYTAPLHLKANGGVFLIDDFGRQIVSPRDLLNRWILPLEERIDYLSLAIGKKFAVPFEQLIIFSTNLNPRELVDEAFLRRIRHKIHIGPPERELYASIFQIACQQQHVEYDQSSVDFLFKEYYDSGKLPRSSDPRDLLEIVCSICRFRNQRIALTPDLMVEAARRFFCQV